MDKGTLQDVQKKVNKIPEEILGSISAQILKGVQHLYEKRVVHRDIKPSNILLNSKGLVKIADFGISAVIMETIQGRATLTGTYLYMSPERMTGNSHSFVSDIWSIGMTILECALGAYPYTLEDKKSINDVWVLQNTIMNSPPKWPEEEFSEEFVDFIKKCLEKDPAKRSKASELLNHPFILLYEKTAISDLKKWLSTLQ